MDTVDRSHSTAPSRKPTLSIRARLVILAVLPLMLDRVRLFAQTRQERIDAVERLCIAHASAPEGQVTISIGVASLVPGVAQDAEHLVEAADIALYAAKRRGRNAVVAYGAVVLAEAS